MSSHLSRLSFWLAGLAAGGSLLVSGREGALLLVTVAALSLIAALWLRRAQALGEAAPLPEPLLFDDAAMLEIATAVTVRIGDAANLAEALARAAESIRLEFGARGLRVHRAPDFEQALIAGARPGTALEQALGGRIGTGDDGAFAMPVTRDGRVVAVLEADALALPVADGPFGRWLALVRAQLESVARRDAPSLLEARPAAIAAADSRHAVAPATAWASASAGGEDDPCPSPDPEVDPVSNDVLLEHLPASVFIFEPAALRILAVSRQAENEFGLRRALLVGKTVQEAFHSDLAAQLEPALREALLAPGRIDRRCDWTQGSGAEVVVQVQIRAMRGPDGSPIKLLLVAQDASGERQAERRSLASQDRVAEFTRTIGECMFVTDPERSVFELIGGDTLDVYGRPAHEAMADFESVVMEDRHLLTTRFHAEMAGESVDTTMRVLHPSKGQRWLRTRTRTLILPDGRRVVHGVATDATADRQREGELERARDEAQAASRAKSQFMANMSHEIRTPMNGILGMTELLLSTPLDERQRRFAKAVYRSGESLLEIINDILDFSKIEAGKLELARADFSLRALVEDTLELLAPRAHEKGLELSFHESQDVPAWVHGDPLRLRQVLTNLIANAIKFTEHGEVVIALERDARGQIRFSVRDTGIGIDNDVLPRLFSAFMQANGGMSRRYGGTGLGLAISRQLIELMGGRIDVTSQPGVGSQFCFSLPFGVADPQSAAMDFDAMEMPGLRVLVVEDHETNRIVLENMLDAWGMSVTLVEDGQAALELLRSVQASGSPAFDLALVDMHMPRLDGMALAHALKAEDIAAEMKMILLSSVSSPDDVRAAQDAGFHRFVAKPIRKSELRQAIAGASASLREKPNAAPLLTGHVLVIEDNPVNQEVIGQMLRQMGLQVRVASGALRGLRALCEAHFDLVLMDIQMPGMDGVEALGWLRRGSGDRFQFVTPASVAVIAVTANALGGDEERFLGLGFDDYLSKPFRQSQLLAMLTQRLKAAHVVARNADKGPEQGLARQPARVAPASASTPLADPGTSTGLVIDAVEPSRLPDDAAVPGATVLDPGALARLRELDPRGESRLIPRIVRAFETSAARFLPQVAEARRLGDVDSVRLVAHTLKSSAASVGAMKLSQQCGEIESMVRLGKLDGLEPRVDAMCAEIEIVLQALKRLLDGNT